MIDIIGIENLDNFIIEESSKNSIIMLYFGAEWCGPCKKLKNLLNNKETIQQMPKLAVAHLDIEEEENAKIVKRYKITNLPTQVLINLHDNKVVEITRIVGYDFTKLQLEYSKITNE
jgi:thioredoxin-like negative regulator of GroEL